MVVLQTFLSLSKQSVEQQQQERFLRKRGTAFARFTLRRFSSMHHSDGLKNVCNTTGYGIVGMTKLTSPSNVE